MSQINLFRILCAALGHRWHGVTRLNGQSHRYCENCGAHQRWFGTPGTVQDGFWIDLVP